jgi:DNA invertase Pin-like site-specific DNA recombinase
MTILKLLPIHRVSTADQAKEKGEGLDRQRETTRRLVEFHGAIALPAIEIIDVSGSDVDKTPEWRHRVLPQIADPDVHVAVDSIDRILRAEAFNFRIMQDLLAMGTRIYAPGKVHDLGTPEDSFMAGLLALVGGREKAEIKRRINAGREAARRRGEWPLRDDARARGITYDRPTKTWGYDEREARVVRQVFEDFVLHGQSMRAIGQKVGKAMQTIRVYLKNPIYKGWLVFDQRRGEAYPVKNGRQPDRRKIKRRPEEIIRVQVFGGAGQQPALVEPWMWEAAQRRLAENSVSFLRRRDEGRPDAWASGYLVSAVATVAAGADGVAEFGFDDDSVMHHVYANGGSKVGRRYSCRCVRAKSGVARCGFRNPEGGLVNQTLDAYLTGLTRDGWFLDAVREAMRTGPAVGGGEREALERRLAELLQREERLVGLALDGRIGRERHDREQDRIRADREATYQRMAELEVPGAVPTENDLLRLAAAWAWESDWDHTKKRTWLARYVVRIALSNDGIERALIRVPAGDDGMPVYIAGRRMDWVVPVFSRAAPRRKPRG